MIEQRLYQVADRRDHRRRHRAAPTAPWRSCQEYAASDPRIQLHVQEKREGKTSAINLFLAHAQEQICVLESGDTLPHEDAIENLVRMFRNPAVGMTGAQKVAVNTPDHVVGLLSYLRLKMEHQLCLEIPRLGELIAFRKVFDRLPPDVAMDEAFVEALVVQRGLQVRYAPDAVVYNMGPQTVSDFVQAAAAQLCRPPVPDRQVRLPGVEPAESAGDAHRPGRGVGRDPPAGDACLSGPVGVLLADAGLVGLSDQEREARRVGHGLDDKGPRTGDPEPRRSNHPFCGEGGGKIRNPRSTLLTLLKVAISLGLVAYIVTRPTILDADWGYMLANLRPWPWLLGLAIYFVAIGLNVFKWQYLLSTLGVRVAYPDLFRHNLVGLFFANLLNMIGADVARGWDLARGMDGTPGAAAPVAVSVLVDRLVGLAAFLVAAVAGLAYAVAGLGRADMGWLLVTMIIVLAAYALGFALLMSQRLRRLMERIFRLGPLARAAAAVPQAVGLGAGLSHSRRGIAGRLWTGSGDCGRNVRRQLPGSNDRRRRRTDPVGLYPDAAHCLCPVYPLHRRRSGGEPGGVRRSVLQPDRPAVRVGCSGHVAGHAGHYLCQQPAGRCLWWGRRARTR